MSSLFKLNQLSIQQEPLFTKEEQKPSFENPDREIYALRQQLQTLKTLYKNAKTEQEASKKNAFETSEDEYSKLRIEKLMSILAEREKQMRGLQLEAKKQHESTLDEWEKERHAKQMALEEISALHGQLEFLKTKISSAQNVIKNQQEQIQHFQTNETLNSEQLKIGKVALQEKNALELENETLKNEKSLLFTQLGSSEEAIQRLNDQLKNQEFQYKSNQEEIQKLLNQLKDTEQKLELSHAEKTLFQENALKALSAQEDAEARLKIAHFHLAKKVKETTTLNDLVRNLESQVKELTIDVNFTQEKILELQRLLEESVFQEERKLEHLKNSLIQTEVLAGNWEKKYIEVDEKCQERDQKLKEFKNLEEKLYQMKSLWMSFGKFFEEAGIKSNTLSDQRPPQQSLFEVSQSPKRLTHHKGD